MKKVNDDITDYIREIIENGYVHNRNYEEVDIIDEGGVFRRKIEETKYIVEYTRNVVTINLTPTSSNDIKVDGYEAENDNVFIIDPLNFLRILGYKVYAYKQTTDKFVITLVDYVADNFAWETAGYFWSVNGLTYANANTPVDDVTHIVNKWDSEQGYKDRVTAYNIVITIIY